MSNLFDMKICSKCKTAKLPVDFHRHKKSADGLQHYCIACVNKVPYRRVPNEYDLCNGVVTITIHSDKHGIYQSQIDCIDYPVVKKYYWSLYISEKSNTQYLQSRRKEKKIWLHRLITDAPTNYDVDHIDRDGLNNRRDNLRVCTHSQNLCNQHGTRGSSKYKGVYWNKNQRRWIAYIKTNGKQVRLGSYRDENKAAEAYNCAALNYHGEFARLNEVPA